MPYIYISNTNNPFVNIAIEEYLYSQAKHLDKIYMFWINSPSVFIGKYQCPEAEANIDYLKENKIPIIRRISGGGTVYHDLGNLNMSVIENEKRKGAGFDMSLFVKSIQSALKENYSIDLVRSDRGDLRFNNIKVAGSAQAMKQGRMLYHLCMLFDTNLTELEKVLQGDNNKSSRVSSVRSKVVNIKSLAPSITDIGEFQNLIISQIEKEEGIFHKIVIDENEINKYVSDLIETKFGNDSWTFSDIGMKK